MTPLMLASFIPSEEERIPTASCLLPADTVFSVQVRTAVRRGIYVASVQQVSSINRRHAWIRLLKIALCSSSNVRTARLPSLRPG